MFERIHQKLGTAGFIISIVALVAALGGGAYAASGGLNAKQKKEVEKISKKYAGKNGQNGANGPVGPQGLPGAVGAAGAAGSQGSVGPEGPEGPEGEEGQEGSPWAAGGTLPNGATETGQWGAIVFAEKDSDLGRQAFPISFTIPLATAPEPIFVGPAEASAPGCPGRGTDENGIPKAAAGKLCVYASPSFSEAQFEHFKTWSFPDEEPSLRVGASPTGTVVEVSCKEEGCIILGSWAVTAAG